VPSYPLTALVLRKTKLGETDLILTLLAADGRQVRAVAKGARGAKSRIGARAEPFTVLELLLHTGKSLEIIAEAQTISSHDAIRGDLDRTTVASVVADVLDKISVEGQAEPKLFDMALVTLDAMEGAPVSSLRLLVLAFLLKALAMHGYLPSLGECASCGSPVGGSPAFSIEAGGVLCEGCTGGDRAAVPLSADARGGLRALLGARMAEVAGMCIERSALAEMTRVVRAYVGYHLPTRLRALDYYIASE
jgi:DNA repair protein RecO (recombination protein O)